MKLWTVVCFKLEEHRWYHYQNLKAKDARNAIEFFIKNLYNFDELSDEEKSEVIRDIRIFDIEKNCCYCFDLDVFYCFEQERPGMGLRDLIKSENQKLLYRLLSNGTLSKIKKRADEREVSIDDMVDRIIGLEKWLHDTLERKSKIFVEGDKEKYEVKFR